MDEGDYESEEEMGRGLSELTPLERAQLDALRIELQRAKPSGWSIVWGLRELIVRSDNRSRGKVRLTIGRASISAAFHDRLLGRWTAWTEWSVNPELAPQVLAWSEAQFNGSGRAAT